MPTDSNSGAPRLVTARRALMLSVAAVAIGAGGPAAKAGMTQAPADARVWLTASGEGGEGEADSHEATQAKAKAPTGGGEGEGGEAHEDEADFLASLGFIEGHIRAGFQLYAQGDRKAARTHMGHPLEEKFEAVEHELEDRGFDDLEELIEGLADAAEANTPLAEIEALYLNAMARLHEARAFTEGGAGDRIMALARLTRIAAKEYGDAMEDGAVEDLHEYQDAWGFLQAVKYEAEVLAGSDDGDVKAAAETVLQQVATTDAVFGDIQGGGDFRKEPKLIYAAAARIELAALSLD